MTPRPIRFALLLSAALSCTGRPSAASGGWDRGIKPELLARFARDQAIRDTLLAAVQSPGGIPPTIIRAMNTVDSSNLAWLKPMLLAHGFPTRAALDSDGVEAVFLMIQHADREPAFQAAMLPKLEAAYHAGEVDGQSVALLTDRVAKAAGRPQIYGTQTTFHGKEPVFDPIADSAGVDARRAAMGLPPLAVYKHMLDSMVAPAGGR